MVEGGRMRGLQMGFTLANVCCSFGGSYKAWVSLEVILPVYYLDPRTFGATHNFDFPKTGGKFYELYEGDAEIGHKELDWKIKQCGIGKCRQVNLLNHLEKYDFLVMNVASS